MCEAFLCFLHIQARIEREHHQILDLAFQIPRRCIAMLHLSSPHLFAISFFVSRFSITNVLASPLVQVRDSSGCSNLAASYDDSCWETLGLTEYLSGWTAPACGPGEDGSTCCHPSDNWSTCYLRLAKGQDGYNCSEINNGFCTFDPNLSPTLDPSIIPQAHYIVKNIFSKPVSP